MRTNRRDKNSSYESIRSSEAKLVTSSPAPRAGKFKRPTLFHAIVLCATLVVGLPLARDAAAAPRAAKDDALALVQLNGEPLATYERTKPPKGKKIDFASNKARSYRAQLVELRNEYRAWLRKNVPGAKITAEFDISLNAVAVKLNGATLDQVSSTPMVRMAQYQGHYYPNQADPAPDPDLALILAEEAWDVDGGQATAGEGVKVAIIDSGIDQSHPCFDGSDYDLPENFFGDKNYTNNKVIAARVFNNQLNRNGYDAEAVDDHGTHVAGTVACNYQTPATVNGVDISYAISGVAPRALLGNYNVFPGDVESARSEDILNALEAAYTDGFDVANMSLGGGSSGVQDLLTIAVDNLDRANMVVTISNGNEGPGPFTVGSPGMAERGLTAGASSVPHFVGAPVTTVPDGDYGAASGDFETVSADYVYPLGVVEGDTNGLNEACEELAPDSLDDRIALISRGSCSFSTKIRNAEAAGAIAVLVVNNVAGDPTAMAEDGTPNQPIVPAYMVSLNDVESLIAADDAVTTIGSDLSYVQSSNANIMAGFSSQGPTDVRFRVKPDVVAPGVNVLSSVPASACEEDPEFVLAKGCFAFFSGTSMSAPHLAGSAAVIRGQHPQWSAAEVRSAVVNTAQRGVLLDYQDAAPVDDVNVVGAGLENLLAAVNAAVALDPVSLAFGGVPSGSGQTRTMDLTVTNLGDGVSTYYLSISGQTDNKVSYSVSQESVALEDGASAVVQVTMTATRGASGMQQAFLEVKDSPDSDDSIAHAALFTLMK
ncbi:MAG: S8 family serine peptidase [Halioglobus sp.]